MRRPVYKWENSGGRFGGNPLRRETGLGQAARIEKLEVYWTPSGRSQSFGDVAVDQCIEIVEDRPTCRKLPFQELQFGG